MGLSEKDTDMITSLHKYNASLSSLIVESKKFVEDNGVSSLAENIFLLFRSMMALEELCVSNNVTNVPDLLQKLEKLAMSVKPDSEEAEHIESYFRVDIEWNKFLQNCDNLLEIQSGPKSAINLLEHELENAVYDAGCQVVVISHGCAQGASMWKSDTECPFPVYLDRRRELFSHFHMERSVAKIFGCANMKYYVKLKLAGTKFITPYQDIPDDAIQIGGDVVMNKEGTVHFTFVSKEPSDRPCVTDMIKLLQEKRVSQF